MDFKKLQQRINKYSETWTNKDFQQFLQFIRLENFIPFIVDNNIDGSNFLAIIDETFDNVDYITDLDKKKLIKWAISLSKYDNFLERRNVKNPNGPLITTNQSQVSNLEFIKGYFINCINDKDFLSQLKQQMITQNSRIETSQRVSTLSSHMKESHITQINSQKSRDSSPINTRSSHISHMSIINSQKPSPLKNISNTSYQMQPLHMQQKASPLFANEQFQKENPFPVCVFQNLEIKNEKSYNDINYSQERDFKTLMDDGIDASRSIEQSIVSMEQPIQFAPMPEEYPKTAMKSPQPDTHVQTNKYEESKIIANLSVMTQIFQRPQSQENLLVHTLITSESENILTDSVNEGKPEPSVTSCLNNSLLNKLDLSNYQFKVQNYNSSQFSNDCFGKSFDKGLCSQTFKDGIQDSCQYLGSLCNEAFPSFLKEKNESTMFQKQEASTFFLKEKNESRIFNESRMFQKPGSHSQRSQVSLKQRLLELHSETLKGGIPGGIYLVENGMCTIGRDKSQSIVSNQPDVSRFHAQILQDPSTGGYFLQDLGSTFGTFILLKQNWKKLLKGDQFQCGFQVITVQDISFVCQFRCQIVFEIQRIEKDIIKSSLLIHEMDSTDDSKVAISIGRSPHCNLSFQEDQQLSESHAFIIREEDSLILNDTSLLGTWIRLSHQKVASQKIEILENLSFKIGLNSIFTSKYIEYNKFQDQNEVEIKSIIQNIRANIQSNNQMQCKLCNEQNFQIILKQCNHPLCFDCFGIIKQNNQCPFCEEYFDDNDLIIINPDI